MIAVIFEVWPARGSKDEYLAIAACVYRKPCPAMISILAGEIPCCCAKISCSAEIIPCSVAQGIWLKAFEFARVLAFKISHREQIRRNSLFFSLLAGNLAVETGSTATASATTQSFV